MLNQSKLITTLRTSSEATEYIASSNSLENTTEANLPSPCSIIRVFGQSDTRIQIYGLNLTYILRKRGNFYHYFPAIILDMTPFFAVYVIQ